jgi:hypothetical protein
MTIHLPLLILLSLPLGSVVVFAQTEHITPFTGTWKLNLAKSIFDPGPPFKSFTIAFAPDGTRTINLIRADGHPHQASLPWSDGKEVSVTATGGMENGVAVSKINGNTFDDTWKDNGKIIEKVHGVLSLDGRTLTITTDGTNNQGSAFHNQLTFDRQ